MLYSSYTRQPAANEKRNNNYRPEAHGIYNASRAEFPNQLMFMVYDQRSVEAFAGVHPFPSKPAGGAHLLSGQTLDKFTLLQVEPGKFDARHFCLKLRRVDELESRIALRDLVTDHCLGFDREEWGRFIGDRYPDAFWNIAKRNVVIHYFNPIPGAEMSAPAA